MDVDARIRRNVTDAEKAQLLKEGRCFESKCQGHMARHCPTKRKRSDTPRVAKVQEEGPSTPRDGPKLSSAQEILRAITTMNDEDYEELAKLYTEDEGFVHA